MKIWKKLAVGFMAVLVITCAFTAVQMFKVVH